jgi:hypothetical protein
MKWTPKQDARLRELFEKGLSDSAIAEVLTDETGLPHSRDSVKNRASRLGLEKDPDNGATALFTKPRQYKHLEVSRLREGSRVLVAFNDMQIPFQDITAIKAVAKFAQDFDPHLLVACGDGFDFYGMSDFDKNPSRQFTMQEELDQGRRIVRDIEAVTKNADRYWVDGNHEDRLRRFLWSKGAAVASLRSLDPIELMGLNNWHYLSYGSSVSVMGVVIEHGDGSGTNLSHRMFARRGTSGICGHSHRLHDYHVTNAGGAHRYIENGCMCLMTPEYVARPNWQQAFTYGIVKDGKLSLYPVLLSAEGFRAEGTWYRR